MNKQVFLKELHQKTYQQVWDMQQILFQQIIDTKVSNRRKQENFPTSNHFLFVEHPPVFTLGKTGKIEHLLLTEKELHKKGIQFIKTNRGGDITFHGPGQIVGYPILDLDNFFTDIHKYLRLLEEVVIRTLAEYGVKGERSSGETGVWIDVNTPFARKICAFGVRASRWVTMHGFAFNVNTDLRYFDYIIPCGIRGKGVTSLSKEIQQKEMDMLKVKKTIQKHFADLFEVEWVY